MTTSPNDLPGELRKFQHRLEVNLMPQQLQSRVNREVEYSLARVEKPRLRFVARPKCETVWLPLRFHCLWERGALASELAKLVRDPGMIRAYCTAFECRVSPAIRVAWKAAAPGWQNVLRRKPRLEVGRGGGGAVITVYRSCNCTVAI